MHQLEADLAEQRKDFETAIAELRKETDAKIERVAAQIELNNTPIKTIAEH